MMGKLEAPTARNMQPMDADRRRELTEADPAWAQRVARALIGGRDKRPQAHREDCECERCVDY